MTQTLSIFGIANEINILVWMILIGAWGELVQLITTILQFLAWDKAYSVANDAGTSAADAAKAEAVGAAVRLDVLQNSVGGLLTNIALAETTEDWWKYNVRESGVKEDDEQGPDGPPPQLSTQLILKVDDYFGF